MCCCFCFHQFPHRNRGLHQCTGLEIDMMKGEGVRSPWCMQTINHHQMCMVERPGRPVALSVHSSSQGSCSLLYLDLAWGKPGCSQVKATSLGPGEPHVCQHRGSRKRNLCKTEVITHANRCLTPASPAPVRQGIQGVLRCLSNQPCW